MQQQQGYQGVDPNEFHREWQATRSAMHETGHEQDEQFMEMFAQKFAQQMMQQMRGEMSQMRGSSFSGRREGTVSAGMRLALGIGSVVMLVPLSAILVGILGFVALVGLCVRGVV